jgi:hypothetical protein
MKRSTLIWWVLPIGWTAACGAGVVPAEAPPVPSTDPAKAAALQATPAAPEPPPEPSMIPSCPPPPAPPRPQGLPRPTCQQTKAPACAREHEAWELQQSRVEEWEARWEGTFSGWAQCHYHRAQLSFQRAQRMADGPARDRQWREVASLYREAFGGAPWLD